MNGKHAIYRVYQALCAGMLRLFPAGRQTLVQGDGCITRIPEVLKTHGIKAVQIITTPGTDPAPGRLRRFWRSVRMQASGRCYTQRYRLIRRWRRWRRQRNVFLYPAVRRSLPSEAALLWTVPRWRERAQ